MTNPTLEKIYRFPVKGFPGQLLEHTAVSKQFGIPFDRRFAITRGTKATGEWMHCRSYYINSRVDGLQKFSLEEPQPGMFRLISPSGETVEWLDSDPSSLSIANQKIPKLVESLGVDYDLPAPALVEQTNHNGNWDFPNTTLSIMNASSMEVIGDALGKALDPIRFRGNFIISGMKPWEELSLMGKRIRIGSVELDIMRPIQRCPAPGVDPVSGERDIDFANRMPEIFGHAYCGMYALVANEGKVKINDEMEVLGRSNLSLDVGLHHAENYSIWPRLAEVTQYEIGDTATKLSLKPISPWPFPDAKTGQRLRFHLGANEWTSAYITLVDDQEYHLEVGKSETSDPVTEKLRSGYKTGDTLIVSGPFGR